MDINKISATLQLALRYEDLLSEAAKSLFIVDESNRWQIVVIYIGNIDSIIETLNMDVVRIGTSFLTATISKQDIGTLSDYIEIVQISLPAEMSYIDIGLSAVCANNIGLPTSQFNVTGKNVLIGIVDTGINYSYLDFLNLDGTTRIKYLWDQTIQGNSPEKFKRGSEYTEMEINTALQQSTREEKLRIVPSEDEDGHGTALASIAAGNGRGSNGVNKGIATESDFIIVKIGNYKDGSTRPTDRDVMEGIAYVLDKAKELQEPVSILLGVGDNLTGHDGITPLEQYIDEASDIWTCNITVGTGNEANKGCHVSGTFEEGNRTILQFIMQGDKTTYGCCLWKGFIDDIELVIQAPNGERTDALSRLTLSRAYLFDNTAVLINFVEPTTNITQQEIFIWFQGQGGGNINKGQWSIAITPLKILEGKFNIWAQITESRSRFLNPTIATTITSPATANKITAVGAFNAQTKQIAPFSGRGYTIDGRVKPALVAPGIGIPVANKDSDVGYISFSGTSGAAAFVAGAYALMLQYGIYVLQQSGFYGQRLRVYLIRTARRPDEYGPYPNNSWGYGILCIEAALTYMLEVFNSTS